MRNSSLTATFDTFSSNTVKKGDDTAGSASDIYVLSDGSANQATASITNSILGQNGTTTVSDFYAASRSGATPPNLGASGFNVVSNNPASPNGLTGTITGTNPNFASAGLTNNGGPTKTISLTPASTAAIAKAETGSGVPVDQRGLPRNASPDIGAFETQVPTVNITDTGGSFNGNPFSVTAATVAGTGNTTIANFGSPALSYKYYAGTLTAAQVATATPLSARASSPGNYTVVGVFTSNVNGYRNATSAPVHFSITGKLTPTISDTPGPVVVLGTGVPLSATATLAGGSSETGTITFTLYNPNGVIVYLDAAIVNGPGTYSSNAPAHSGTAVPTVAGTYQWIASYSGDANNNPASTTRGLAPERVVGPGATLIGTTLYLVGGNTSDQISIQQLGSSNSGSTGIQISGSVDGMRMNNIKVNPPPSVINITGFGGNDCIFEQATLTVPVVVSEAGGNDSVQLGQGNNNVNVGNGNDNIQVGVGSNTVVAGSGRDQIVVGAACTPNPPASPIPTNSSVTVGNGNDSIRVGAGNNTIVAGNGNDNIQVGGGQNVILAGNGCDSVQTGDGSNYIALGNGNDYVVAGNGNNIIVAGSGNNYLRAGNGVNLIAGGPGRDTILAGNGDNILIDGSVQLTQPGDTLSTVLANWVSDIQHHDTAAQIAALIAPRLSITFNKTSANTIEAGNGFDWFWATYAHDHTDRKSTDLLN